MAASVVVTYARAFADAVLGGKVEPGKVLQEAQGLVQVVASSKDLREVWETPSIPVAQKISLLDAIAAREGISPMVRNFFAVVIDHRRTAFLGAIVVQFEREVMERLGFTEAEISSARELSAAERTLLESQVGKLTGKKVRAKYLQNKELLGGTIIKVGSTIYDGSVKGQLEKLRERLVESGI
jgi:F-type H+-transporting ATPase subunit delta